MPVEKCHLSVDWVLAVSSWHFLVFCTCRRIIQRKDHLEQVRQHLPQDLRGFRATQNPQVCIRNILNNADSLTNFQLKSSDGIICSTIFVNVSLIRICLDTLLSHSTSVNKQKSITSDVRNAAFIDGFIFLTIVSYVPQNMATK